MVAPIHDNGQAVADAAGVALVTFSPSFDEDWYVERIFIRSSGVLVPDVTVYVGSVADSAGKDWSTGANPNIADESSPIYVPGGSTLLVRFTAATVGSLNTASIQYRPESLVVPMGDIQALAASGAGVDGLLIEAGFPNQVRMPRGRR